MLNKKKSVIRPSGIPENGPYYFSDISHHKGEIDPQVFADAGHRICITKASDSYHMPDKDGNYDFSLDRHWDSRLVENFIKIRQVGLGAGAYHFSRWDRPIASQDVIVSKNMEYYLQALGMLPEEHQSKKVCILDWEQHDPQMAAAGIPGPTAKMQEMCKAMVEQALAEFEYVIIYIAWWWWEQYLTKETQEWLADKVSIWVVFYCKADELVDNKPPNPLAMPWVPSGFKEEYATSVDTMVGKIFARQYTSAAKYPGITSGIDNNLTFMPKSELFKIFGDGSVDPPEPPIPPIEPTCVEKIKELISTILKCITGG